MLQHEVFLGERGEKLLSRVDDVVYDAVEGMSRSLCDGLKRARTADEWPGKDFLEIFPELGGHYASAASSAVMDMLLRRATPSAGTLTISSEGLAHSTDFTPGTAITVCVRRSRVRSCPMASEVTSFTVLVSAKRA